MTLNRNGAIAVVDNDYAVSVANHKSVWNWVSDIRKEVCVLRSVWINRWIHELLSSWCRNRSYAVVAVAPVVLVGAGAVPSASANAGASANAATRADEAIQTFKFFM